MLWQAAGYLGVLWRLLTSSRRLFAQPKGSTDHHLA